MSARSGPVRGRHETTADVVVDLQRLRAAHGDVSFGEIARRIAADRVAAGFDPEQARIGRSTVYDTFRPDRPRIKATLIAEVVMAITGDATEAAAWGARVRRAAAASMAGEAVAEGRESAADAPLDPAVSGLVGVKRLPVAMRLGLAVAATAANLILGLGSDKVLGGEFPLHLDMIGTAVVAFAAGPWWAASAGVATNVVRSAWDLPVIIPLALVQVVGAVLWGYGVRRWSGARSYPRFALLNIAVAVACSLVAVPVLVVFGGGSLYMPSAEHMLGALSAAGLPALAGMFLANLLISVPDKLLAGAVGLACLVGPLRTHGDDDRAPLAAVAGTSAMAHPRRSEAHG